jgi:hypothetical protein
VFRLLQTHIRLQVFHFRSRSAILWALLQLLVCWHFSLQQLFDRIERLPTERARVLDSGRMHGSSWSLWSRPVKRRMSRSLQINDRVWMVHFPRAFLSLLSLQRLPFNWWDVR